MIKNLKNKELIEMTYKLSIERNDLIECMHTQDAILKDVADLMYSGDKWYMFILNLIMLPFRLNRKLKQYSEYFYIYKLDKMNKQIKLNAEQLIEALDHIDRYEAKNLHPSTYKDFIQNTTKLKFCNTCGSSLVRAHNDFQTFIMNQVKDTADYLMPSLTLVSGKYSSDYNMKTIRFKSYVRLHQLVSQMKKEVKDLAKRGYTEQANLTQQDIQSVSAFIMKRLKKLEGKSNEMQNVVEAIKDAHTISPIVKDKVEEVIEVIESTNEVEEVIEVIEEVTIEKVIEEEEVVEETKGKFILTPQRLQIASERKKKGEHLKTIASDLNVPYKGLAAAIRKYNKETKDRTKTKKRDNDGAISLF